MATRNVVVLTAMAASLGATACSSMPFGGEKVDRAAAVTGATQADMKEVGGIGVNAFLWRSSLDTIAFMPLASADPWGGVINTEWYANPEAPDERFKVTIYILDTRLRADGIAVNVNREVRTASGWESAQPHEDTAIAMENAILERARLLRLASIQE